MNAPSAHSLRTTYLSAVQDDLIGPSNGESEILRRERPSDRYLTGILYPDQSDAVRAEVCGEEDDDHNDTAGEDDGSDMPVPMVAMRRPSSMGISFKMRGTQMSLRGSAGRYSRKWLRDDAVVSSDEGRQKEIWIRTPVVFALDVDIEDGLRRYPATDGLQWWVRAQASGDSWQVTVVLENMRPAVLGRVQLEELAYFQATFQVRARGDSSLLPRHPLKSSQQYGDEDVAAMRLIYRDVREWAVGHTCSATWSEEDGDRWVGSTWLPVQLVPSMSAEGHETFGECSREVTGDPARALDAEYLANADTKALTAALGTIPAGYRRWIANRSLANLSAEEAAQARSHLSVASAIASRMEAAIDLLAEPTARRAFQLAQRAMLIQRRWSRRNPRECLRWRPFQLGFQLLAIAGLIAPRESDGRASTERLTMDLLWFPTGGGKTEAYLALIAFVIFLRRLRTGGNGAGVAALMRYTLRLLTIQQFERAARVILACEYLRRDASRVPDSGLGDTAMSIGLWVGADATPNDIATARSSPDEARKARQLTRCPACQSTRLDWDPAGRGPYLVYCRDQSCPLAGAPLPIHTIDEDVYAVTPSLVVGTVDKFAQITRKTESGRLLGVGRMPPDLILQDELHLISGPLGTVVGVYESAIDQICSRDGVSPKIIGSTATIRRARDQVLGLFNRQVCQFPPPAIDWDDSCFAVRDRRVAGRLYAGVTSAGRSPKFTLQAVCAALMQRAAAGEAIFPDDQSRDPYWTLLAYFNSMRELGGAHVMMLDDVNDSMRVFARSHGGATPRTIDDPLELTSRVPSAEIPETLARLEASLPAQDISVVLATNMISVGVDIPRLGLMVINGQPKSMAEYIQASSRVGRGEVPGVIVTAYNAGRARDRAHYEAFRTWHQALYRDVEATSVTPFAPRARDKALHAAVVAMARHLVPGMGMATDAELTQSRRAALEVHVQVLLERVTSSDPEEADETRRQVSALLDLWEARGKLRYWDEYRLADSLLVSAEKAAEVRAVRGTWSHAAMPTPNSMREVEPSVRFRVAAMLRSTESQTSGAAPSGPASTRQESDGNDQA